MTAPDRPRETKWQPLIAALGREPAFLPELLERYGEPHRRYHGVDHIDALARLFEQVAAGPGWRQPAEVALAILFHDAIYEPGRPDNEARSAALARSHLADQPDIDQLDVDQPDIDQLDVDQLDVDQLDVERIVALIEATAKHGAASTDGDPDLGHFLDADVAILGAPPEVYACYARGVFEEYAPVVDAVAFRAGRRAFVENQLAQSWLFHTPWFRRRYENIARENLARELADLTNT